ncbi:MAG: ribosome maturation factor RimM [Ruthenibacterium sp.]
MKDYIEAGEIVTTHGILGEVKLYPWCDTPEFIAQLSRLFFTADGGRETKIEQVRVQKDMCLVRLAGVHSIEEARPFLKKTAYFQRGDVTLPKGRYFVQDILGATVKDADTGKVYGTVTDITHPAAHDIYTVKNDAGETFLFPAVPAFLETLSPQEGLVTVHAIPGMFDSGAVEVLADAD